MSNDIPRRIRIDLFTPAEKAIWEAAQAVEALPPDVRLTRAVILLSQARDLVADYVDGVAPLTERCLGRAPADPDARSTGDGGRCALTNGHEGDHARHTPARGAVLLPTVGGS